jgi:isopenicillin N synthase-like dioxygenase
MSDIIVDLARTDAPRRQEKAAAAVGEACAARGYFLASGHGIADSLVERAFAETERFHRLPLERKLEIRLNEDVAGYRPPGEKAYAASVRKADEGDFSSSYFIREEFPPDHPDRLAQQPWTAGNQWVRDLPGFRETMLEYFAAMVALARRILVLQSIALGLEPQYLCSHEAFRPPRHTLRLLHYPPRDPAAQYGFKPHTDLSFITILAQSALPGLELMVGPEQWMAGPSLKGHMLVMTGDMAQFWTNDRFRTMPHRVINNNGRDRYSIPFFVTPRGDVSVQCFPGCSSPANPPRYPEQSTHQWMAQKWGRTLP